MCDVTLSVLLYISDTTATYSTGERGGLGGLLQKGKKATRGTRQAWWSWLSVFLKAKGQSQGCVKEHGPKSRVEGLDANSSLLGLCDNST
jgi:hypothetical protein